MLILTMLARRRRRATRVRPGAADRLTLIGPRVPCRGSRHPTAVPVHGPHRLPGADRGPAPTRRRVGDVLLVEGGWPWMPERCTDTSPTAFIGASATGGQRKMVERCTDGAQEEPAEEWAGTRSPPEEVEGEGVSARTAPAARRNGAPAGMGEADRGEDLHRVRGSRHRG